ncbi:MAG: transposase family protein [Chloroflexia bacterium]|nr:transposase family protein [Chloroflexia bacterium]
MAEEFALLLDALGTIPDVRNRKGRRHPLPGVLGLVVLGVMANCRSLSAISRYAQIHPDILPPLGLIRTPSVPTLSRVLAGIDPAVVRGALLGFTRTLLARRAQVPAVVALDGKSLRGVHEHEAPAYVLHVFAHEASIVLDQVLVPSVRDEVAAADQWISTLATQFPGLAVLTADALDADQDLCATIVAQDYAYLPRLKKPGYPPRRHPIPLRQRGPAAGCPPGEPRAWPPGAAGNSGLRRPQRLQPAARSGPGG